MTARMEKMRNERGKEESVMESVIKRNSRKAMRKEERFGTAVEAFYSYNSIHAVYVKISNTMAHRRKKKRGI